MPNTVITLKKSATPSAVPSNLANGEIAINYADGKLFYKNVAGQIVEFSSAVNAFGTINANGTLVISDTLNDVVTLVPGTGIGIIGDALNDTITFYATGNAVAAFDASNVSNSIAIAAFQQANTARNHANAAFDKANAALANTTGTFAGSLTITENLNVRGNVSLGDASTDTITINGATITLGNNQSIDSGTLFIDATNNRVGIGTTSPLSKLSINGTGSSGMGLFIYNGQSAGWGLNQAGEGGLGFITSTSANTFRIHTSGFNFPITLDASTIRLQTEATGNVGIGTVNPQYKLDVVGTINAANLLINGNAITTIQGTTGAQGIQGITGSQGAQGIQGIQGIQGRQGTQGVQGANGIQGITGSQGTTGAQGTTGTTGAQGTTGSTGTQGAVGAQGTTGTTGSQGATGSTGAQGTTGTQGSIGLTGSQGTTGATGAQGTQGVQGVQGVQGANGIQGLIGSQGVQGIQGIQGRQGTQGIQGIQGANGIQGLTGTQGTQGIQGIQGANGIQGITGSQGIQGIQGANGIQGITGSQGTQGIQGVQGVQGTQGIQGIQGITGSQGTQGTQGIQGPIGPSTIINANSVNVNDTVFPVFVTDAGSNQTAQTSPGLTYNPSSNTLTISGGLIVGTTANISSSLTVALMNVVPTIQASFDQANTARTHANAAFDKANNALPLTGGTITGSLSIAGNLTVSGNTTFVNAENLRVADPLLYLAGNNYSSDIVDIGFIGNYVNATGQNVHTGFYREHVDKMYYLFNGYDQEPANNHIGALSNNMVLAVLNADLRTSNLTLAGTNAVIWIRSSFDQANTARNHANAAHATANAGFDQANTARTHANTAHLTANAAFNNANAAFLQANTARDHANAAFLQANTARDNSNTARTVVNDTANTTRYLMFANGTSGTTTLNVAIGLTFNPSSNTLNINGPLNAVTKSFVIPHPTKVGKTLRYGSLEGPENGVYVRGQLEGSSVIELPDYWWNLIDHDTITVHITPYGRKQDIWVQSRSAYAINLNQPADCFFTVFAERKDVDKLVVEF